LLTDEQTNVCDESHSEVRRGLRKWGITIFSTILGLCVIIYSSGIFSILGLSIGRTPVIAFCMAWALGLAFLLHPAKRGAPREGVPWYDALLIIGGFAGSFYVAFWYEQIMLNVEGGITPTYEVLLGLITIVVVIEATRRVAGNILAAITLIFFLYPLFINYLPGILGGRALALEYVVAFDYLNTTGIFGTAAGVAIVMVIIFILFGELMVATGAGTFFIDLALAAVGPLRGGPAKAAVIASALFGTISGSTAANVATTGCITIPLMKKSGYDKDFAGAVEAVSSNGGQIMPPVMGAVAFIIAEFLGITYAAVCIAAAVPAILYFAVEFMQVDLEAAKRGLKGIPRSELPSAKKTMREGWYFLLPIVILLLLMIVLLYSPQRSAFGAVVALVIISSFVKGSRLNMRRIIGTFEGAASGMCLIATVCASAGIITGAITGTGFGMKLSSAIIDLSGGSLLVMLVLISVACYILGMGIGGITIYIILAILLGPALVKFGVVPLAAHLFIFWLGLTSYLTPPVCIAAFVAAGIAGGNPMRTGWIATRLGIVNLIIPFIFVYDPSLLLIGSLDRLALQVTTALIGAVALSAALAGYLLKPCGLLERLIMGSAAIILLWPRTSLIINIVGTVIFAATVLWQLKKRKEFSPIA
jgi:TRAP transporter 4TM/12TM fusion protein